MRLGTFTTRLPTSPRFKTSLTLIKRGSGEYVDGLYVEGNQNSVELIANVQPASQDDRNNLEIGERVAEIITVYIRSQERDLIRPMRQGANNSRGDIMKINNLDYEVYSVDNFSINGHIKALCFRRENQDG